MLNDQAIYLLAALTGLVTAGCDDADARYAAEALDTLQVALVQNELLAGDSALRNMLRKPMSTFL